MAESVLVVTSASGVPLILTAGANITLTPGAGVLTIAAAGGGGGITGGGTAGQLAIFSGATAIGDSGIGYTAPVLSISNAAPFVIANAGAGGVTLRDNGSDVFDSVGGVTQLKIGLTVALQADATNVTLGLDLKFANASTQVGIAGLGSNCPAGTLASPYTWVQCKAPDGTTCVFPIWN